MQSISFHCSEITQCGGEITTLFSMIVGGTIPARGHTVELIKIGKIAKTIANERF